MDLAFDTTVGVSVGKLGMTMAAMAYLPDANAIASALATNEYTKDRWSLIWFGVDSSTAWEAIPRCR
jgi:hypothetical protein